MELSQAKLKHFSSLNIKKIRQSEGLFIAEGLKNVKDLILHQAICETIIYNPSEINIAELDKIPDSTQVYTCKQIQKLSSLKTAPGIVGVFRIPNNNNKYQPNVSDWTLILDNINDPGNMGTIIRTAHWYNVKNIILFGNCTDIYASKVVQSTMGSLVFPHFYECKSEEDFKANFWQEELPLIITSLNGKSIQELEPYKKGYLVMGSESHGVQDFWIKIKNAQPAFLPFVNNSSHPESLNVAIASAIFMHHFIQP